MQCIHVLSILQSSTSTEKECTEVKDFIEPVLKLQSNDKPLLSQIKKLILDLSDVEVCCDKFSIVYCQLHKTNSYYCRANFGNFGGGLIQGINL